MKTNCLIRVRRHDEFQCDQQQLHDCRRQKQLRELCHGPRAGRSPAQPPARDQDAQSKPPPRANSHGARGGGAFGCLVYPRDMTPPTSLSLPSLSAPGGAGPAASEPPDARVRDWHSLPHRQTPHFRRALRSTRDMGKISACNSSRKTSHPYSNPCRCSTTTSALWRGKRSPPRATRYSSPAKPSNSCT